MKLEIPDTLIESTGLTDKDLKNAMAVSLYQQGCLDLEQASQLCACNPDKLTELLATLKPAAEAKEFDMDAFLSWASHDLKTPLNSIIGFSRIVLKGIDGPVSDLQTADLTLVNTSGQRMLTLLSQLVEMARLNCGETKANKEQAEIIPLIEAAVDNWQQKNPDHQLLTNFAVPSPPPGLNLDAQQVRQVVANLLTYAGLHVAAGGQIRLSLDGSANGLTLTIKSSGTPTSADVKMEAVMLSFISRELLKLNGAELELCQADENGANIRFIFLTP